MHLRIWQNILNFHYWYFLYSVTERHNFYAAPAASRNFDVAPPLPSQLFENKLKLSERLGLLFPLIFEGL
jgi:hypothetical protein